MFANTRTIGIDNLKAYAGELKLDTKKFNSCLDTGQTAARVKQDMLMGQKAGVTGTPACFVNGRFLSGQRFPYAIEHRFGDAV